jgi:uncharacterized membrane protein YvlD (DUF360 family)
VNTIGKLGRLLFRFIVLWGVDIISLAVTALILSGVNIIASTPIAYLVALASAALMLGLVNLIIRPLVLLLALPFGFFVIFGVGFFINAITLRITAGLMPSLEVTSWWMAFIGGLILAMVNTILTSLMTIDDQDSFYEALVIRLARRKAKVVTPEEGQGVVMLEIDGLSYYHVKKAIEDGWMPTLKEMIDNEGYVLSHVEAGVPCTTPACQAGILLGNNFDIPSFRWYDKDRDMLMAGPQASAIIEPDLVGENGLLVGGSSINNMFSGNANKAILTFSRMRSGTPEDKRARADDIYLLLINPYFFSRTLVLFFKDVLVEVWEGWQQRRKNVEPRLNRLEKGYPFLRAATNVFLRDVAAYLIILDIIRGQPMIYSTFAGYDEVAHHSGPWTEDAMKALRDYDKVIATIREVIKNEAGRPYELIILSDHGQSFGATFEQRYGESIHQFIASLLPADTQTVHSGGGDDGTLSVGAMLGELENIKEAGMGGAVGKRVVNTTQSALKGNLEQQPSQAEQATVVATKEQATVEAATPQSKATVCHSGNIAQVYFDLFPRKIRVSELNAAYPGLVDQLVDHPGVGFVIGYDDEDEPIVFGKEGARNLHTGDVTGVDPLAVFGDPELRSWQMRRVADFPHAGDLIVNSTFYPDGTVAALEELVGNHGGLGGEQTDSFLFHPPDFPDVSTRNSYEVNAILESRRGLPARQIPAPVAAVPEVDAWAPANLARGLGMVATWLARMGRVMLLSREAFQLIADDPLMTGPAVLIALTGLLLRVLFFTQASWVISWGASIVAWLVLVLVVFGAARLLGGKANFTQTLRVLGFVQGINLFLLLGLIPGAPPIALAIVSILSFFAAWLGAATAHALHGWRTLILPVVIIFVLIASVFVIDILLQGAAATIQALGQAFGLIQ